MVSGHEGKTGRSFIDGNEYCNTQYSVKEVAEEEETTNSCSAGHNEYEYGNTHLEGSVEADWDVGVNPFSDTPVLRAGQEYDFKAYVHSLPGVGLANGPNWIMNMKVNNVEVMVKSKGVVTVKFDYKSTGPYSYPSGSDSSSGA